MIDYNENSRESEHFEVSPSGIISLSLIVELFFILFTTAVCELIFDYNIFLVILIAVIFLSVLMILNKKRNSIYVFEHFIVYKKYKVQVGNIHYVKLVNPNEIKIFSKGKVIAKAAMIDKNADKLIEWIKSNKIPILDKRAEFYKHINEHKE
ncbi:MAG: hypothetical protein ACI4JW_09960 [Oscillospiraceae bacterium]